MTGREKVCDIYTFFLYIIETLLLLLLLFGVVVDNDVLS